jgi:hypothetical protein
MKNQTLLTAEELAEFKEYKSPLATAKALRLGKEDRELSFARISGYKDILARVRIEAEKLGVSADDVLRAILSSRVEYTSHNHDYPEHRFVKNYTQDRYSPHTIGANHMDLIVESGLKEFLICAWLENKQHLSLGNFLKNIIEDHFSEEE